MMRASNAAEERTTIAAAVAAAARALAAHSDSPRLDAELLLGHVLGVGRAGLVVRGAETLPAHAERLYGALIGERARGAPIAYLVGSREFWSLTLAVTPAVLVPRPETELLVELALELMPEHAALLDLGTGSGAIALAVASERPKARIVASDVSEAAIEIARGNARDLGLSEIDWRVGSWLDAVPGERFDLIVANPPYVAAADPALAALAAEPRLALVAGPTGLEQLEIIVRAALPHLAPGGWLLLEHGASQDRDVARLLKEGGFARIRSHVDHSGRPRVTRGAHPAPAAGTDLSSHRKTP